MNYVINQTNWFYNSRPIFLWRWLRSKVVVHQRPWTPVL